MAKVEQKNSSDLVLIRPNAAGIDLGAKMHYAAIPKLKVGQEESNVKNFSSDLSGVKEMAEWLKSYRIDSVAMEATGVYWLSVYEYLEQAGFEVFLVHAQYVKQVAGRKSDVSDSQWIQQLHSYGLLSHAFVPADKIRELRCYVRNRQNLEREKSECLLKMHKALDMMNVKIHHCLSDMAGVAGMRILRTMASGKTDIESLAAFYSKQFKSSEAEFRRSLAGNYRSEHLFMLKQNLDHFDFLAAQMCESEVMIERVLSYLTEGELPPFAGNNGRSNHNELSSEITEMIRPKQTYFRKNQYGFDLSWYLESIAGVDLTAIEGLDESTVLSIIGETGIDFTKWDTSAHFTSWLRLVAQPKITGGKRVGHFRIKTTNRATQAFRIAAMAVRNTKSALGSFYRRLRSHKGPAIAIKATARKIAVIFYKMMTEKVPYRKANEQDYQKKVEELQMKRLSQQAAKLGFSLQKV